MYRSTSKEFNSIINGPGRMFRARMVCGSEILTGFRSIKIISQANEDTETISIGGAVSSYIEVIMNKPVTMVAGKEYRLDIGLQVNGQTEWVPMGLYTPQAPKGDDELISFTAYDRLVSKFSGAYFTDITSYMTDGKVILQEIAKKTGVPINVTNLPDGIKIPKRNPFSEPGDGGIHGTTAPQPPFSGYTYRETIKYLAQIYGSFATMNRSGELEFRWYTESGINVGNNRIYNDPESAEKIYQLQQIVCTTGQLELKAGGGVTGIFIENPVMTQEILDKVWKKIGGMQHLPSTCQFFGDIRLDLGDIVTVIKRDGMSIKIPVMSLSIEFDGGITTEIGSYGNTEEEEHAPKGPTATVMDRVYTDLLLVRDVVANKVSADYLEANYASITQLNAVDARIDKITATDITTEYLEAHYAQIDCANVDTASIRQGFLEELMVSQGIIADRVSAGEIVATDVLTGVKIYANDIVAGRLDASQIEVTNLKAENITVGRINGQQIAPGAIDFGKLTEDAITGVTNTVEIGGCNLLADSASYNFAQASNGGKYGCSVILDNTVPSKKIIQITCMQAGAGFYGPAGGSKIETGKEYTFSFYAKCSSAKTGTIGYEKGGQFKAEITQEWKKFSHTFTANSNASIQYSWYLNYAAGDVLSIHSFKLECGNKATGWTPAPEDIDASISDNSIVNWSYGGDKNYMDGKVIYAETISGNKIISNSITATQIDVKNLVATGLIEANRLTANNIDVNNLFAQNIIAAGSIHSKNYKWTSGAYADSGLAFGMATGQIVSKNFSIDANGNAYFRGQITSSSGKIGGFTIGASYLANNTTSLGTTSNSVYVGTNGISCGTSFKVTNTGIVTATGSFETSAQTYSGANYKCQLSGYGLKIASVQSSTAPCTADLGPGGVTFASNGGSGLDRTAVYGQRGISFLNSSKTEIGIIGIGENYLSITSRGSGGIHVGGGLYFEDSNYAFTAGGIITASDIRIPEVNTTGGFARGMAFYGGGTYTMGIGGLGTNSKWNSVHVACGATWWTPATTGLHVYSDQCRLTGVTYFTNGIILDKSKPLKVTIGNGTAYTAIGSNSTNNIFLSTNETTTILRGSTVYLKSTSTVVTSDRRFKENIGSLEDYETFFECLEPSCFVYKKYEQEGETYGSTSNRYHLGFVAQEVYEALLTAGLSTGDFAGYVDFSINGGPDELGLAYSEFVALNTHMIQKTRVELSGLSTAFSEYRDSRDARITELETQIQELREEIEALKTA